ncbi:MAG: 4Fe-4S binding protein [Anaerotruncus sp.]|nr:4Fe-4S binding protein [Anaerotruncus sp.]
MRPLHPALRDAGPAVPERQVEERRVRLLPELRLDLPDRGHRLPLSARPEKLTNVSNVDLSRRKLLLTTLLGLVAVPFFRLTPSHKRASLKLIRPPGSLDEPKFLAKCVKCGQCMRACPTGGLQPALTEAGPEGIYTPMLVPKIGYCEYYCSLCTQVCPTGAITKLDHRGEEQGQDGHGLGQQEPLHPLRPGQALHRLRGALPGLAQGHQARRRRDQAPRRHRSPSRRPRSSTSSSARAAASARTSARSWTTRPSSSRASGRRVRRRTACSWTSQAARRKTPTSKSRSYYSGSLLGGEGIPSKIRCWRGPARAKSSERPSAPLRSGSEGRCWEISAESTFS